MEVSAGTMINITTVRSEQELPGFADSETLAAFLHESLKPYEDPVQQVRSGIEYALSEEAGKGGFIVLASENEKLAGALVMLNTNMEGFVPPNLLLFVAVKPDMRGQGIGGKLISRAFEEAEGDIKLHVEHENPAGRLYRRMGFTDDYADMRLRR